MPLNCFSCFKPTATNADRPTPAAGPSDTHSAGPSTSRAAERGRVDTSKRKNKNPTGDDRLARDKEKLNLNLNFEVASSSQSQNTQYTRLFSFEELRVATRNFRSECLGKGGFGKVYMGYLDNGNQHAAIKKLHRNREKGIQQFVMEVEVLRKVDHRNLVKLLGFCAQKKQRLIVYEYMALGSLYTHLFDLPPGRQPLDWNTRIQIAIDVASGLEYLHDKISPSIIHRDIKSTNILLGEGYHAKLSDFGIARVGPTSDETHVSTRILGSCGYTDPEYHLTGQLTVKSDIYSLGIILLELITGRKAYDSTRPKKEQKLVVWARPLISYRKIDPQFADPSLTGQYTKDSLDKACAIIVRCIEPQGKNRPSILEVVQNLRTIIPQ